jgi:hypothetical protein
MSDAPSVGTSFSEAYVLRAGEFTERRLLPRRRPGAAARGGWGGFCIVEGSGASGPPVAGRLGGGKGMGRREGETAVEVEGPRQSRRACWRESAGAPRFAVEAHSYGIGACGEQM